MPALVELLRRPGRAGFPAAYLQARLAGRRARWLESCPPGSGDEARLLLQGELDWLDNQLEPEPRRQLAPALLFYELPALLAALRCKEAGDRSGTAASLESSRLHPGIREILTNERSYPETLHELGEKLAPWAESLGELAKVRRRQGRAGLEQALAAGFMTAARREHPGGPVREFLDQLATRQELLRLAKANRWPGRIATPKLPPRQLRRQRLLLARQPAGEADPAALDRRLLGDMALDWRRRRNGSRLEQLLDYLWTIYLVTRDCGVRHLADLLGEERVARETVL
jgi:hypothetical protein